MKTKPVFALALLLGVALFGCAGPYVKTDLASLQKHPETYAHARVILTTDLASLLADPAPYRDHRIEVTGYVDYQPSLIADDWGFLLHDNRGNAIPCYEYAYRYAPESSTVAALFEAEKRHQQITVVGDLTPATRIETDWIVYQGRFIDTDTIHKPMLGNFPAGLRRP